MTCRRVSAACRRHSNHLGRHHWTELCVSSEADQRGRRLWAIFQSVLKPRRNRNPLAALAIKRKATYVKLVELFPERFLPPHHAAVAAPKESEGQHPINDAPSRRLNSVGRCAPASGSRHHGPTASTTGRGGLREASGSPQPHLGDGVTTAPLIPGHPAPLSKLDQGFGAVTAYRPVALPS